MPSVRSRRAPLARRAPAAAGGSQPFARRARLPLLARRCLLAIPCVWALALAAAAAAPPPLRIAVTYPARLHAGPLQGRLLLLLSTDPAEEPRFQISDDPGTQQIFGLDVADWRPGQAAVFDAAALGYPVASLAQVPSGDYYVQALLNIYTTFHRADGRVVELPMDRGEGQQWNRKPGNLYSAPLRLHLDPARGGELRLALDRVIPPIPLPPDTRWIKHLRLVSPLLSKFWGRPTTLAATVLLPPGWYDHPRAHYPLAVYQGHFQYDQAGPVAFRDRPPAPDAAGPRREFEAGEYRFYQDWVGGKLPKFLLMSIQHANPYYDDSYAVDSANIGPYGAAITQELIPAVERRFRGIGQGWARVLYGGSTGGWETLADQIFYPDFFNGAWANCPDPVDFRAFQIVNVYKDPNAYWLLGPWSRVPRPNSRTPTGSVITTMERANRRELVLGTHGRSGDQWDAWQAVFSPVGAGGYPAEIWDPRTGDIDHQVAAYWREHYDLRFRLQRDWNTLGPQLAGKLHVKVGDMDTYYLNNAVHLLQDALAAETHPRFTGDFEYAPGKPHCYTGDPAASMLQAYVTVNERFLPVMAAHILATAPPRADLSWRY